MVSTRPIISKSSNPFINSLETVSSSRITISITVTFIFYSFFSFSSKLLSYSIVFIFYSFIFYSFFPFSSKFFSLSYIFTQWSAAIIIIIIIIIIIYPFRVFHISVSWWFFTRFWVTASLLKSPGLVLGFWLFSVMLSFG